LSDQWTVSKDEPKVTGVKAALGAVLAAATVLA
jgi:hypothetical protein